jgi:hypothetical protein
MSLKARQELLAATAERYQKAVKKQKQRILDEFAAATGYHRKHAITLLRQHSKRQVEPKKADKRGRRREYDDEVKAALVIAWEATSRICSKRLVPFLPTLVAVLEKHGYLMLSVEVRQKLLEVSPATVDRLLYDIRHNRRGRGIGRTQPGALLKQKIAVRTFADWNDERPGFIEADLVAHCGAITGGPHLHTLVFTDIATGWMEFKALLFRDQDTSLTAIRQLRSQLPFELLGLDTDNGKEFLNYAVLDYCLDEEITFTRSRAYKKNDQCYIEQKNGSVMRKFVGYDRYEGLEPCRILDALYVVLRLYVNFFQPSLKLTEKKREGSRVRRKYDEARTPYERVLASEVVSEEAKASLKAEFESLDPVALLRHLDRLLDELWAYAYREPVTTLDLDGDRLSADGNQPQVAGVSRPEAGRPFFESMPEQAALQTGGVQLAQPPALEEPAGRSERQYRHQKRRRQGERWWRTWPDAFADVWPVVEEWLRAMPDLHAQTLFKLLQQKYPGQFNDGQLRTFQRKMRAWRLKMASGEKAKKDDDPQQASVADQ